MMLDDMKSAMRKSQVLRWFALPFASSSRMMWEALSVSPSIAWKGMGAGETEEQYEQAAARDVEKLLPFISPGAVVLDLGCGVGRVMKPLAPRCAEIHGVDIAGGMLRLARKHLSGQSNVRFHRGDGKNLGFFADETCDLSFSLQVFHMLEREDMLKNLIELRRVTKTGGCIYVEFQDFENEELAKDFRKYALESAVLPASRRRFSTEPEVRVLARLAGFDSFELLRGERTLTLVARKQSDSDATSSEKADVKALSQ